MPVSVGEQRDICRLQSRQAKKIADCKVQAESRIWQQKTPLSREAGLVFDVSGWSIFYGSIISVVPGNKRQYFLYFLQLTFNLIKAKQQDQQAKEHQGGQ